ncbi:MAG: hypothetical protein IPJ97_09055 [Proteobacteria bacterium]|nr:hypothetical protein [Pseudomonadota bacterium]
MPNGPIKLLLPELEAEVVGEALELYLQARPAKLDHRYEYRYRAAHAVLDVLQRTLPDEDDPLPGRRRQAIED